MGRMGMAGIGRTRGGRSRRSARRGFTLVEMLVVLAIIGLIASLVGPRVLGQMSQSRAKAAHLQIEAFKSALDLYFLDASQYPSEGDGLEALVRRPAGTGTWNGPYLRTGTIPNDPWGNPYRYRGGGGTYQISSLGADRREGGSGDNADIVVSSQ